MNYSSYVARGELQGGLVVLIINAVASIIALVSIIIALHFKKLSEKDSFTGCYTKDWACGRKNSKLVRMMKHTKRTGEDFGLLFIDMDKFKEVNDEKGHVFGDNIIKMTVAAIQNCIAKQDLLVRFGGDEFIVLFPNTDAEGLAEVAEAIRDEIEHNTKRTVSIGGRVFNESMLINVGRVVNTADYNAYQAKNAGRNRVVL